MAEPAYVTCGAEAASCRCVQPLGHDGSHECSPDPCNGAWKGTWEQDDFEIVRFPEARWPS